MTQTNSIRNIILLGATAMIAVWLGMSLVTQQSETLLYVAGGAILCLCLYLGKKIWLLMIFFSALQIPLIRGFGTMDLGQGLFLGFSLMTLAMRRLHLNLSFSELEFWILLVAATVVQVYIRNPVGLNIFGGDTIGARPYFLIALAFCSGCILSCLKVPVSEIKWAMRLTLLGGIIGLPITMLRYRYGSASAGNEMGSISMSSDSGGARRNPSLALVANILARWLVSWISPVRALLSPKWGLVLIISLAFAAASGYRNSVAAVGLTYFFGVVYRSNLFTAMMSAVAGACLLGTLALVNLAAPLPLTMQRALSPLPGTWDERVLIDGDESTEWRVLMWKEALFTDQWIRNKWLGDGLGMSRAELDRMQTLDFGGTGGRRGSSGLTVQQENNMINGGYHSGPVQTIRTVGYVGLAILLLTMIRLAVHAHRQIQRCRGTEWEPVAYFFGIPLIVLPIFFTLVFGDFGRDVSVVLFGFGIIRLLEKNLPIPAWANLARMPYVLQPRRGPASSAGAAEAT